MAAIANRMALHGGVVPYVATFLVFSDYLRHSVRLSALMHQRVLYILTHDSIGVGEDGPLISPLSTSPLSGPCRGLGLPSRRRQGNRRRLSLRPGPQWPDPHGPVPSEPALYEGSSIEAAQKGGYVIYGPGNTPDAILIATGSEVDIAIKPPRLWRKKARPFGWLACPAWTCLRSRTPPIKESVLPSTVRARVVVEAGTTFGWHKYAGDAGGIIGIDRFGASAPGDKLFEVFGFTVDHLVEALNRVMAK